MAGVLWQTRVVDTLDCWMPDQSFGDRLGVGAVALDAHGEGLDSPGGQPGIHRSGNRPDRELQEADLACQFIVVEHDSTAQNIGVPAKILRRRVGDDVGAERERVLQIGRCEGVVDDDENTGCMADLGEGRNVADLHHRIARRLNPEHLGGRRDGGPNGGEIGHIHGVEADAPRHEHPVHQAMGATVDVVAHDDVVAGLQRGAQQDVFAGESGREAVSVLATLEVCDEGFERGAGRVGTPGVLIAVTESADAILNEGGGLVDRLDDRAGRRIRRLASRDGTGTEVEVLVVLAQGEVPFSVVLKIQEVGRESGQLGQNRLDPRPDS